MSIDLESIISFLEKNFVDGKAIIFFLFGGICFFLICFFIIAMLSNQKGRYRRLFLGLLCIFISAFLYGVLQHFKGWFDVFAGIVMAAIFTAKLFPSKWINRLLKFWVIAVGDVKGLISEDAKDEVGKIEEA